MRRTMLMISVTMNTRPAMSTGSRSRRERAGAMTQRRMTTTAVIVASARPP